MKTVTVHTQNPYEIKIERGGLRAAGAEIKAALPDAKRVAVLTDDTVEALYGEAVCRSLEVAGLDACRFAFPHGECSKNLACWGEMLCFLAQNRLTRTDVVLALGGGVAGDMAGFAAASYLRGVPFVQVPTTLLAMVDSSVGGKTGVNLPMGKNLAGAFYQPRLVLCDPDTLATLPPDTLADGVAESIKYGVLFDAEMFSRFETGDWRAEPEEIIRRCVQAKAGLVEEDEHDRGSRQLLNLGHTLGHAIEKCSGYGISHGHAVAVGMAYAARLAMRMGLCGADVPCRVAAALERNALPLSAPYAADELLNVALSDKKRAGDTLTFVLPREIGRCELVPVDVKELGALIRLAIE